MKLPETWGDASLSSSLGHSGLYTFFFGAKCIVYIEMVYEGMR